MNEYKDKYLISIRIKRIIRGIFLVTSIPGIILSYLSVEGCSSVVKHSYYKDVALAQRGKAAVLPEYCLGFGDVLEVKFFNNERFNETVTVRPDGRITMEKIGDVFVTGMTPSQLDSLITNTYAEIIREPDVTVFVRQFGSYQAYILGEVNTPGGYPVERDFTLVQALAAAGGIKHTASIGSIMILRQGKGNEVNALKIDISDYLDGEQLSIYIAEKDLSLAMNEFYIQPQDIVYVPKTLIANVNDFLSQVYAGLLPPIDVYLRALLWSR